ncbi:MAG: hypothetical protein CM1200mP30_25220 [Pseudomonadota bacterium]|nr:MAG: hypothetical protein CM1200mP30_25220 [Pseudomonadota bacterium]
MAGIFNICLIYIFNQMLKFYKIGVFPWRISDGKELVKLFTGGFGVGILRFFQG